VADQLSLSLFPVAPTLEHRASAKRFVSLHFFDPTTVGRAQDRDQSCEHGDEPSGSLKLLGIFCMAAQLAASQEGLSSVRK
jgi:hypothetical protein